MASTERTAFSLTVRGDRIGGVASCTRAGAGPSGKAHPPLARHLRSRRAESRKSERFEGLACGAV